MLLDLFVKGGVAMYPLLFCSLAALAVIVERILFFLGLRRAVNDQADRLRVFRRRMAAGERERAIRVLEEGKGPVIRVYQAAMDADDEQEAARAIQAAAEAERRSLFGGLAVLDTVVTAAPFLGLLGTVLGIMHTFAVLGGGSLAARSMTMVGRGIAEALITTATGLFIAVPTLVALNYFVRRAENTNETLEREIACFEWGGSNVRVLEARGQD